MRARSIVVWPFFVMGYLQTVIMPYLMSIGHDLVVDWWILVILGVANFMLAHTLAALPTFPLLRFTAQLSRTEALFFLFLALLVLVTYGFVFYSFSNKLESPYFAWYWLLFLSGLAGALAFNGLAIIGVISAVFVSNYVLSRRRQKVPDALFVHSLMEALYSVETCERTWSEFETKKTILRKLEEAARVVGERVAPVLPTFDAGTDADIREKLKSIAAAIRSKKRWVCTPRDDTRERLMSTLSTSLVNAALGNWDLLETGGGSKMARREAKAQLRVFLVGLFVAFVPLIFYLIATTLTRFIPVDHDFNTYLRIGVVIWAMVSVLFAVDPRLGEKIETLKNLSSMLPKIPSGKRG